MAVDFAALAKRLIDANGRAVTIVNLAETPADPLKPWRGNADPRGNATTVSGIGCFVVLGGSDLGIKFSNAEPDSMVCLFPAVDDGGNQLEDFDEIIDGSDRWRIVETQLLQPGATRFMYAFLVAL